MKNTLYYGDNLDILRRYIKDESVDLIYLDPPFKSNQDYNVLFKEKNGKRSQAQIKAFEDTWHWDLTTGKALGDMISKSPDTRLVNLIKALQKFLGQNDMMAYLVMMAIRLIELYRVLKPTGSIYLHCDPTASHYLKLVMDAIFGGKNFRNEIVWCYTAPTNTRTNFPKKHDTLFRYTKTDVWTFNFRDISIPYSKETVARTFRGAGDTGLYLDKDPETKHRNRLKAGGKIPEDWWMIPRLQGNARERLGYPTQKPEALLERIIKASSNKDDVVLDPFCGCGTTIAVAEKLKRKWIGIDITHLAITLMEYRLKDTFGTSVEHKVIGVPVSIKGAEDLAIRNRFEFQSWSLRLVEAKPEPSKVADKGIDGRIYFRDDPKGKEIKEIIVQVKSGKVGPGIIRDLVGVVEREKAQIGVLITLRPPTTGMIKEIALPNFYKSPLGYEYPKIQILTIEELLGGKRIDYPSRVTGIDATFRKAERYKKEKEQEEIEFK